MIISQVKIELHVSWCGVQVAAHTFVYHVFIVYYTCITKTITSQSFDYVSWHILESHWLGVKVIL